jgi:hypothetical protein
VGAHLAYVGHKPYPALKVAVSVHVGMGGGGGAGVAGLQ